MAGFDIITPIWGVIENIANGPHHTFVISEDCGYSGREVTNMLHGQGIRTWFHNNSGGYIEFNTRKSDAAQAQQVLNSNGIQTASPDPAGYKPPSRPIGKKSDKRTMNEIAVSLTRMKARSKGEPYQPGKGWSLW